MNYMVILYIFIIAIVLHLLYHVFNYDCNTEGFDNRINKDFQTKLSEKDKQILLNCLSVTNDLFQKYNIWYTIAFGTLLGSVRHSGIIPWDDDIDLMIQRKDLDKIKSLSTEFEKNGFKLEETWKLLRIYATKTLFIDLFIIDTNEDNKIVRCENNSAFCKQPQNNQLWWHKWFSFPSSYVYPLKKYKFEELELFGPNKQTELLTFWYGPNHLTECKTHFLSNHDTYVVPKTVMCSELGF